MSVERHDGVTIALHWATAGLVVFQFLSAEFWDDFPHPEKHLLIIAHMSLGVVLATVLLARIGWRMAPRHVAAAAGAGLLGLAARAMHVALYTLLGAQMVLGVFTRWTDNHPLCIRAADRLAAWALHECDRAFRGPDS